jgi:predicted Zn-dependent protease
MNFGIPLAFLKFSRGAEAEADYLGLQYMYKSGYDPNAYVTFFGKIVEEERRHPGSAPKIFMDHPPTQDRILKSEQAIKEILPQKEQYLVTTSEFEEIKDRLRVVVAKAKKQDKSAPTLRKREPSETASTQAGDDGRSDQDDRPVLRRRN